MTYRQNHINIPNIANIIDEVFNNEVFGINNIEKNFKKWPTVNIIENDEEYLIQIAAPGLKKDDFNNMKGGGQMGGVLEWKEEGTEKKNR